MNASRLLPLGALCAVAAALLPAAAIAPPSTGPSASVAITADVNANYCTITTTIRGLSAGTHTRVVTFYPSKNWGGTVLGYDGPSNADADMSGTATWTVTKNRDTASRASVGSVKVNLDSGVIFGSGVSHQTLVTTLASRMSYSNHC